MTACIQCRLFSTRMHHCATQMHSSWATRRVEHGDFESRSTVNTRTIQSSHKQQHGKWRKVVARPLLTLVYLSLKKSIILLRISYKDDRSRLMIDGIGWNRQSWVLIDYLLFSRYIKWISYVIVAWRHTIYCECHVIFWSYDRAGCIAFLICYSISRALLVFFVVNNVDIKVVECSGSFI